MRARRAKGRRSGNADGHRGDSARDQECPRRPTKAGRGRRRDLALKGVVTSLQKSVVAGDKKPETK
jgi:hypothetical protein